MLFTIQSTYGVVLAIIITSLLTLSQAFPYTIGTGETALGALHDD